MKIKSGKSYGVITGDIVSSSKLKPATRRKLPALMQKTARVAQKFFEPTSPLAFSIFSGDSWQCLVDDPAQALRVGLLFRAHLRGSSGDMAGFRGIDTRLSIAIGTVDFVPADRVTEGEGAAFRLSGRGLKELQGQTSRMKISAPALKDPAAWELLAELCDEIIVREWTVVRSMAVASAIMNITQEKAPRTWREKVTQSAISRRLNGARWQVVERVINQFAIAVGGQT